MSRLEEAEQRLRALEREIFQLKRFGRDRFEVGDVIRFTKTFIVDDGEKRFDYAVLKTEAGWYTTGRVDTRRGPSFTYEQLIEFIVQYPTAEHVQVATAWVDVTEADNQIVLGHLLGDFEAER